MDRVIVRRQWNAKKIIALCISALAVSAAIWMLLSVGGVTLNVDRARVTVSEVKRAAFTEYISVSGTVEPLRTLYLDAADGGKILRQMRKENVGFVFQSFNLIDELTIFENVEPPLLYHKITAAERKKMADLALERMSIMHRRNHFPQQLSGGQQQRAAVARAIVGNPQLIFADEPTGNLDSTHGDEVMRMLLDLNEAGTTIVMVTHSPTYAEYGHRVIHLFDGKVVAENVTSAYRL